MTLGEAMRAVGDEYNAECRRGRKDGPFLALLTACICQEYEELDEELMSYVAGTAIAHGLPAGTIIEPWIRQLARMCFRFGMRAQRKIDHPDEPSSSFWRSDKKAV